MRSIAAQLGRAPSTISREIKRNGAKYATEPVRPKSPPGIEDGPKTSKLAANRVLARLVAGKLRRQWSPEQVAGWLKRTYPDDPSRQVSPETLYRSLFIQARGALKKELVEHLRRRRVMRRSRHHTQKTDQHGRITDTVSISERPANVEDRAVPGHWEGDLLFGSRNSQIATLVERQTRYVMLVKVAGEGHRDRHRRVDQERSQVTARTLPVADLGSGQRDGRSQALHIGDRHQGLLLRPAESLAAWQQ